MTIVLTYTTEDGIEKEQNVEEDVVKIDLSRKRIQSIDLSPLASCTNLQTLSLDWNQLQAIDLSPLSSCSSLQTLLLHDNQLQSIDLSPLAFCSSLQILGLEDNQFQSDDAIHSWLRQEQGVYRRPTSAYPWSFLRRVTEQFGTDRRVQQDILYALGLGIYGFIDCDFTDQFLAIPPQTDTEVVRETLTKRLVEEIVVSIDRGGPTTGLNFDILVNKHGEIATRANRIIELRMSEIQQVYAEYNNEVVDLRELWLTAYGYDVLNAIDFPIFTNDAGPLTRVAKAKLKPAIAALTELGFDLKRAETSKSMVKMSDELKQAIRWIVENQGRPWKETRASDFSG